jgi:hypothetical protein
LPQFYAGEQKTAKVTVGNPTGKPFDYNATLYLGVDQLAMDEAVFSLNAGESKQVNFGVTMPPQPGVYPVYLSVFSGGQLLGLYQATENLEIVALPPFDMTITKIETTSDKYAPAWWLMQPVALVSNPHGITITHKLRFVAASGSYDPALLSSFTRTRCWGGGAPGTPQDQLYDLSVTLEPGQSVTLVSPFYYIDGLCGWEHDNPYEWSNMPPGAYSGGVRKLYYHRLIDELGNSSPVMSIGTIP